MADAHSSLSLAKLNTPLIQALAVQGSLVVNSKISYLTKFMFFSLLLMMQWWTQEGKWWTGTIVFLILAIKLVPKAIQKYQHLFELSVIENNKLKALSSTSKMWFIAQGYFLALAFIYYLGMAIVVSAWKMEFNLGGFGVAGVFWLQKVVGLGISNMIFVPVVCLLTLIIFNQSKKYS